MYSTKFGNIVSVSLAPVTDCVEALLRSSIAKMAVILSFLLLSNSTIGTGRSSLRGVMSVHSVGSRDRTSAP